MCIKYIGISRFFLKSRFSEICVKSTLTIGVGNILIVFMVRNYHVTSNPYNLGVFLGKKVVHMCKEFVNTGILL